MRERLKERRLELGLTLQDVGNKTASSKSYIWELENNNILKPSAEKLQSVAEALETTVNYLLTGNRDGLFGNRWLNMYVKLSPFNKELLFEFSEVLLRNQQQG